MSNEIANQDIENSAKHQKLRGGNGNHQRNRKNIRSNKHTVLWLAYQQD